MIFCYAWTNYLIINMVNVKTNIYPDERADLIIKSSPAIDANIVEIVKSMNVFENIYFVDYVAFRHKGVQGLLTLHKKYKGHYSRFVDSLDKSHRYDKVLVAGYWNDVLYMLNALWKRGDRFKIDLVEEGELSYEELWKLFQPYIGESPRGKVFHQISTCRMKQKFNGRLTKKLFLYTPSRQDDKKIHALPMPKMEESNPVYAIYKKLYSSIPEWKKVYYTKRNTIFFSNYLLPQLYEESYNYAYTMIDTMLESMGDTKVIIKAHTSSTEHRLNFAKDYEEDKNVYVDRDVYIFEALFCDPEIENKILVAKHSAVLIHPVAMFGREPYVFLLYKLYPWYKNFGDKVADKYVEDLRNLYSRPERIYAPNTILEFKMNLMEIKQKLGRKSQKDT